MIADLEGKVVVITGGSTGIGAATAREFARHRCNVVVHYNASEPEAQAVARDVESAGGKAAIVRGDLGGGGEVKRVAAEAKAAFGRIDVLINNAGSMLGRTMIGEYTEEYLLRVLSLNVIQVALFMHEVAPVMRAQGGGSIINVTSVAARNGGGGGAIVYGAAKGFVLTATRGWAKELAVDRIRVNSVAPGVITTPFHERYSNAAQLEAMRSSVPLGRLGVADECTGAFLFLASASLSGYITGQTIDVNGGQYMS